MSPSDASMEKVAATEGSKRKRPPKARESNRRDGTKAGPKKRGATAPGNLLGDIRAMYDTNPESFIETIYKHRGLVQYIAEDFNTRRQTLNRLLNEREELQDFVEDAREGLIDRVEKGMFDIIDNPQHPKHALMLIYVSKTIGKGRGYIERPQDDRTYAPNIQITVNTPWGALGPQEAGSGEVVEGEVVNEIEGGGDGPNREKK